MILQSNLIYLLILYLAFSISLSVVKIYLQIVLARDSVVHGKVITSLLPISIDNLSPQFFDANSKWDVFNLACKLLLAMSATSCGS